MSHPWALDFSSIANDISLRSKSVQIEPYGFVEVQSSETEQRSNARQTQVTNEIKMKRAWDIATSPGKSIFMTLFMLWMSGNSVHIFSIMITLYTFINPVKAIFAVNSAFSIVNDLPRGNLIAPKLLFIAINLGIMGIALYKCNSLGLLPSVGDWVSFMPVKKNIDYSYGVTV